MKITRIFHLITFALLFGGGTAVAQDAVTISDGNYVRGTVKGTNYSTVALLKDDQSIVQYFAKDIKEFVWNGETYVSKPIVLKKKMEYRFFKLEAYGAVNLYSFGGMSNAMDEPQPRRSRIRPSVGIGAGSGGFGGVGVGGGITFGGGGRSSQEPVSKNRPPSAYFIEKYGTGPMQELPVEGGNSEGKNQQIKNVLLQKLSNDEDLAERIKATESFDAKLIKAFVTAYNEMHKP